MVLEKSILLQIFEEGTRSSNGTRKNKERRVTVEGMLRGKRPMLCALIPRWCPERMHGPGTVYDPCGPRHEAG